MSLVDRLAGSYAHPHLGQRQPRGKLVVGAVGGFPPAAPLEAQGFPDGAKPPISRGLGEVFFPLPNPDIHRDAKVVIGEPGLRVRDLHS